MQSSELGIGKQRILSQTQPPLPQDPIADSKTLQEHGAGQAYAAPVDSGAKPNSVRAAFALSGG